MRDGLAFGKIDGVGFGMVAPGKPPGLVKFVGVWEIGLGHQANHRSVRPDQACCVEQAAGDRDRQSNHGGDAGFAASLCDDADLPQGAVLQGALVEEIAAGVGGEAKFGKNHQLDSPGGGIMDLRRNLCRIEFDIRHPKFRRTSGDPQETEGTKLRNHVLTLGDCLGSPLFLPKVLEHPCRRSLWSKSSHTNVANGRVVSHLGRKAAPEIYDRHRILPVQ